MRRARHVANAPLIVGPLGWAATAAATPPVHQETITAAGTATSQVVTGSMSGGTDQLYIVSVANRSNVNVTAVSGLSLTWTERVAQCAGRNQQGMEIWTAFGSPSAGTVTVDFASSTNAAVVAVSRYSGADTTIPFQDAHGENTSGPGGGCSGEIDSTAPQLTLQSGADDSVLFVALGPRNEAVTGQDPDYTEHAVGMAGTGTAAGRRVQLPWGRSAFDFNTLTADGKTLVRRALEWASSSPRVCDIEIDQRAQASDTDGGTTMSFDVAVAAANDNVILVVGINVEDATAANCAITDGNVHYDGSDMTRGVSATRSDTSSNCAHLWYMLDPPTGTNQVSITFDGTVAEAHASAIVIYNARQQAPEATGSTMLGGSPVSSTCNPTTLSQGAWVVDQIGSGNAAAFTNAGLLQVERGVRARRLSLPAYDGHFTYGGTLDP